MPSISTFARSCLLCCGTVVAVASAKNHHGKHKDFKAVLYIEDTDNIDVDNIINSNFTHLFYSFVHMHRDGLIKAVGLAPPGTPDDFPYYPVLNPFIYYETNDGTEFRPDLDSGKIPTKVRDFITQHNWTISEDVTITAIQKAGDTNTNWAIKDNSNGYIYQATMGYYSNQNPTNFWFFDPIALVTPNTQPIGYTGVANEKSGQVWQATKKFKEAGKKILFSLGGAGDCNTFEWIEVNPTLIGQQFAQAMKTHPGVVGISIDNECELDGPAATALGKMFAAMTKELGYKPVISGAPYGSTNGWYGDLLRASVYEKDDGKGNKVKANYIDWLNSQTYNGDWDETVGAIPDDVGIDNYNEFVAYLTFGGQDGPGDFQSTVESYANRGMIAAGVWRQRFIAPREVDWANAIMTGLKKGEKKDEQL